MWGHEATVGYFSQDHKESIRPGSTIVEWLSEFDPSASQQELRGLLGQMLFSGDDATKRTEVLSGGEAARLIFCRLMLQKPNFLILDEPTNHLDLESINALNLAVKKYDGTVLGPTITTWWTKWPPICTSKTGNRGLQVLTPSTSPKKKLPSRDSISVTSRFVYTSLSKIRLYPNRRGMKIWPWELNWLGLGRSGKTRSSTASFDS
jgi:hypothetical protein